MGGGRPRRRAVTLNVTVHTASAETSRLTEQAQKEAAEAARSKQPQKRKARPGQLPPQRRQQVPDDVLDNSSADPSSGDEASEPGSGGDDAEQQPRKRGAALTWHERNKKQRDAWDLRRPGHTAAIRSAAPRLAASVSAQEECIQGYMHDRIQHSLDSHTCCQHAGAELQHIGEPRTVTYLQMGLAVAIKVPTVQCTLCSKQWEVSACDVHCFPSSPVVPNFWVDVPLLQFFQQCTFKGGLSGTAFVAAATIVRSAAGSDTVHRFSAR